MTCDGGPDTPAMQPRSSIVVSRTRSRRSSVEVSNHAPAASAHEVRPAYLSVEEVAPNEFDLLFKTPMQGEARLALSPQFSGRVESLTPVVRELASSVN